MAITSRDQLIAALANSRHALFDKASISNAVAGRFYSLWRANGQPGQGAIPAAAALCNKDLLGALPLVNQTAPMSNYLAWVDVAFGRPSSSPCLMFDVSNAAPEWQARSVERKQMLGGSLSTRGAGWPALSLM
jgi:hypothetical protein